MLILQWILIGINLTAIVTVGMLLKKYLPKYFEKKAENLATKEDIGHITDQIEAAKFVYSSGVERLRADLDKTKYVHQKQFDLEIGIYQQLWKQLVALRRATASLRPMMDSSLQEGETEEQRKRQRATAFLAAFNPLTEIVEDSRPFYAEDIWQELRSLCDLTWSEAVEYRLSDRTDWEKREEKMKSIQEQTNRICELIRSRISHLNIK